ncbi:MAG: ACT domain-containing protein [Oscillospiraceae bacterium]|nr:ACT domain-containing protein [Oscillospiraceae bacterium]
MTIEQLSVFIENKPGKLVEALELLSQAGIDLRALSLADTADFGILRIIVDQPSLALERLQAEGYLVRTNQVVPVSVGDKPGGLAAVLRILANNGIDVEYTYAFVAHASDMAYVILRVADNDVAVNVLKENGIALLTPAEMFG